MPINRKGLPLCNHDLEDLLASGLDHNTIKIAGIYTEYDPNELARILKYKNVPFSGGGMVMRYFDGAGQFNCYAVVKPHTPRICDGEPVKYEAPIGEPPRAYISSASHKLLNDGAREVVIVEGIKKALAVEQLGHAVISVSGVWNWKVKDEERLQPDLTGIKWAGMTVYICFDYDPKSTTRQHVDKATKRLAALLLKEKAEGVKATVLPPGNDGDKNGVDDWLITFPREQRAEAFRRLLDEARKIEDRFSNYIEVVK